MYKNVMKLCVALWVEVLLFVLSPMDFLNLIIHIAYDTLYIPQTLLDNVVIIRDYQYDHFYFSLYTISETL